MANQLKNIVRFVAVPAGGMSSMPHGLTWQGMDRIPDFIAASEPDFSITATATDVTVTNNGPLAADVDVLLEAWHTIERAFGPEGVLALVPRPFILVPEGGGAVGNDHTYLPEAWEENDVAAGLAAHVVAASVSQLFDEITLTRATSIVGLRTDLTEAITAGQLTVFVSVNGVATAAQLVHTAGLNPSGGGVAFAPGAVPAVAGDRVGILITTTAGFLPITTDLSVRVEVGS